MATGAAFLDAHYVVRLVDVHRHAGAVGLDHVHFVLGVAVGVGLYAHHGGVTADLGDRGSLHLGRDVAGEEGLVTALVTPRLAVVGGRVGSLAFRARGGRCGALVPAAAAGVVVDESFAAAKAAPPIESVNTRAAASSTHFFFRIRFN